MKTVERKTLAVLEMLQNQTLQKVLKNTLKVCENKLFLNIINKIKIQIC
jgi:hypothetical protein